MNGIRKLLCFVLAGVFAAFALPSLAADKLFTVSVSVTGLDGKDAGGVIVPVKNSMVLVDFANRTPLGVTNSVINQVQVPFPLAGDPTLQYNIMTALSKTVNNGSCPAAPAPSATDTPSHNTTINLNNITGVKTGGHYCLYLTVTTSLSTCTLTTWKGTAGTGGGNGQPFYDFNNPNNAYATSNTYDGCDGTLDCGQTAGQVTRGDNWGGQACFAKIDYDFNFDPTGTSATSFITIKNGQQFTVQYVLVWNKVLLSDVDDNGDGVPDFHPLVSYGTVGNNPPVQDYPNNFDFVPAPACLSGPDVLAQGFDPNAVMPTFPDAYPYNQTPVSLGGVLPDQYHTGTPAKMCIAQLGWVSLPGGYVQERAVIIDQSDSFVWP